MGCSSPTACGVRHGGPGRLQHSHCLALWGWRLPSSSCHRPSPKSMVSQPSFCTWGNRGSALAQVTQPEIQPSPPSFPGPGCSSLAPSPNTALGADRPALPRPLRATLGSQTPSSRPSDALQILSAWPPPSPSIQTTDRPVFSPSVQSTTLWTFQAFSQIEIYVARRRWPIALCPLPAETQKSRTREGNFTAPSLAALHPAPHGSEGRTEETHSCHKEGTLSGPRLPDICSPGEPIGVRIPTPSPTGCAQGAELRCLGCKPGLTAGLREENVHHTQQGAALYRLAPTLAVTFPVTIDIPDLHGLLDAQRLPNLRGSLG